MIDTLDSEYADKKNIIYYSLSIFYLPPPIAWFRFCFNGYSSYNSLLNWFSWTEQNVQSSMLKW